MDTGVIILFNYENTFFPVGQLFPQPAKDLLTFQGPCPGIPGPLQNPEMRVNAWPNKGFPNPDIELHSCWSVLQTLLSLHMLGCPRDPCRPSLHLSLLSFLHSLASPDLQPMQVSSPQIRHPCASQQASLQHVPDPMVSGPFTLPLHPHLSKESCLCTGPKLRSVLEFSSSHRSCQVILQSPSFHPLWGCPGP